MPLRLILTLIRNKNSIFRLNDEIKGAILDLRTPKQQVLDIMEAYEIHVGISNKKKLFITLSTDPVSPGVNFM